MEAQVIQNPAALEIPEVAVALMRWSNVAIWHDALKAQMAVGAAALIIGTADDKNVDAASIVTLPQAFTDTLPWIVHFHNEGPRELTHLVLKATLDFIKNVGYNGFRALNQSGYPDKVWLKIFKNAGLPQFVGSCYIFDLTKDITDAGNSANRRSRRDRAKPVRRRNKAKLKANRSNAAVVPTTRSRRGRKPGNVHRRRSKRG